MNIEIEPITDTTHWDEELVIHSGSVFLSRAWLEALKCKNRQPVYFAFKHNQRQLALIAGLERPAGNNHSKHLFFYSGIACSEKDPALLAELKRKLLNYSQQENYNRVILKSYDYNQYVPAKVSSYVDFKRAECVINLKREEKEIISKIAPETRRLARKSKRQGLTIKSGHSEELLNTLFRLMGKTHEIRKSKGYGEYRIFSMPFLDREAMQRLLDSKAATLYYAEKDNEILSMQFIVSVANRAYGIWMGTSPEGYKLGAPGALTYETIMLFKAKGFESLNMGGVPLGEKNEGVKKYKLSFGSELIESCEQSTDFLLPEYTGLNRFMHLKRKVNELPVPWKIKKLCLKVPDSFIRGMDEY